MKTNEMFESKITKKAYPEYMLMPALILFFIFIMTPSIASFYYSFTNWNAISSTVKFIGLDNFKDIIGDSSGIMEVFKNSGIFAVSTTVFKILFGLVLAILLNEKLRTTNILRAIFFVPMMLATILLGIMFSDFYRLDGLINSCLNLVGMGFLNQSWIDDTRLAIWSCSAIEVWRASGFAMAVFLAALQMIPKEMFEAADIDGANKIKSFFHITIPYLYQAMSINVILGLISGLKAFDLIYLVTNGGPARASEVLNITVLNEFGKGAYGYSTALGLMLFILITVVYLLINALFTKYEVDIS